MSASWMAGYVSDVTYTLGFYRELAPSFLQFVCESNGVQGAPRDRRLRYCELGCGRGYGTALLAAANSDIDFVGIDFNPTHIAEARALATRAGLDNLRFIETSFGEALASSDPALAEFDIIALHGVYTWVAPEVRRDIVSFLRAKLRSGGIAYVSYNTFPGWAAAAPLQHLIGQIAARTTGDSIARFKRAYDTLVQLSQPGCAYIGRNPAVKSRLDAMANQNPSYLAHEFLNEFWEPIYVSDAFADFAEAKLTFVGSATIGENRLSFCVPKDMFELVSQAPDQTMREQIKDFIGNKQFRRDVYVKGPIALTPAEQRSRFQDTLFALTGPVATLPESWPIPAGTARPAPGLVEGAVARLRQGPATGGELMTLLAHIAQTEVDVRIVCEILIENHLLVPARPAGSASDPAAAARLNEVVGNLSLKADTHRFFASPVLGSAVGVSQFDRLALPLLERNAGAGAEELAGLALARVTESGLNIRRRGKTGDATAGDLIDLAENLRGQTAPMLRNLGIGS
ncbi:class I SAM-dependent methyltransferase [Starkeya koreensis]|uniref:Class I SAM-dependent methyltransferase n=1 Tax=Ancylobacter koreensis TaxID=266121 RepID=A0ABT0DH95_9HYPH|nr:class I SAM-dependent methyltransferase [Ancylobacter koreensis]MCK0206661.1 class I SAM-dependent methyltransferase [Ancylobacter koreensis]